MAIQIEKTRFRDMFYRYKLSKNAIYKEFNDGSIVSRYDSISEEKKYFQSLALCDLTPVKRIGFKGDDTIKWLTSLGIKLPKASNTCIEIDGGNLVAKLSSNEFLFMDTLSNKNSICDLLVGKWQLKKGRLCYQLFRQHSHCCFLISGKYASLALSKLCGVDLKSDVFKIGSVAQTSVARLSSIIIYRKTNEVDSFYLLSDISSSEYLWKCILDSMSEFKGTSIGIDCFC